MYRPSLDEAMEYKDSYNIIPIIKEIYADMETPISIFKRFKNEEYSFLLESVEGGEKWARYSIIGRDPFLIFKSYNDNCIVKHKDSEDESIIGNPINILKDLMSCYKSPNINYLPRFNGGAVGYFGYDLIRFYENLPNTPKDDLQLPESYFMFADKVIVFDHLKQTIIIIVNMHINGNSLEKNYRNAVSKIEEICNEIFSKKNSSNKNLRHHQKKKQNKKSYKSNISKDSFCKKVLKAKEYIKNGDIFQVVLSQRLCIANDKNPFDVYRVLRVINPSPYMYYLKFKDHEIVGSSPEMLVRFEDGIIETCPIAGTRKRGETDEEDNFLQKELLSDKKELAEHTMLVDLARNDIGKISEFGTVKVENLMSIEKYSHVMHIVSNVKGKLKHDKGWYDGLMSVLPAGTLSGAPKIRAMEIIDELETVKRGIYGGAIGYLSFNGNIDSCITIRTVIFKDGMAYVQAGAGIVADSNPESEYEETINKAGALLKALQEAGDII